VALRRNELKTLKEGILERPDRWKKLKQEYRVFINWIANVAVWSTPIALIPQLIAVPKLSIITWVWLACNSTIYTLYGLERGNKQGFVRVAESLLSWAIVLFLLLR
jgi:hypothetical protein